MTKLIDELAAELPEDDEPVRRHRLTSRRSCRRDPLARRVLRRHAREPRRRRARLDARADARTALARQGRRHVPVGRRAAAGRVPLSRRSASCVRELPGRPRGARPASPSTARTSAASAPSPSRSTRAPLVVNVDHHHDNSRFGAVEPDRRRRLVDGRDRRATCSRALDVPLTPEIAEALYVGARHRHGPLPVHEHDAEGAAPRRRARRGGRRRPRRSSGTSTRRSSSRSSSCSRARSSGPSLAGGRLVVSYLLRDDFAEVGAEEPYSEGIID